MESVATHGFFFCIFFFKFNQQRIFLRTRNIHERQKKNRRLCFDKGKRKMFDSKYVWSLRLQLSIER